MRKVAVLSVSEKKKRFSVACGQLTANNLSVLLKKLNLRPCTGYTLSEKSN